MRHEVEYYSTLSFIPDLGRIDGYEDLSLFEVARIDGVYESWPLFRRRFGPVVVRRRIDTRRRGSYRAGFDRRSRCR